MREFYTYLKSLLLIIIPEGKEKLLQYILNEDTIKTVWIPCFTHEMYNSNSNENYETYETLGDTLMAHCIYVYLYQKYPLKADQNSLTIWKQNFLSTDFQSKMGGRMKTSQMVYASK